MPGAPLRPLFLHNNIEVPLIPASNLIILRVKFPIKNMTSETLGADAVDVAIAQGIDFDGTPIPALRLELYHEVMALEANRQRSGVANTMRSRIVRIGAKHLPLETLNQKLVRADFAPLKPKEIAFYYGEK
jgi:hypothetical protein